MDSNSFDLCFRVNPHDSVPEALSKVIEYLIDNKFLSEYDIATVAKTGKYDDLIDKPTAFPNPYPVTINGHRYDGSEEVKMHSSMGSPSPCVAARNSPYSSATLSSCSSSVAS